MLKLNEKLNNIRTRISKSSETGRCSMKSYSSSKKGIEDSSEYNVESRTTKKTRNQISPAALLPKAWVDTTKRPLGPKARKKYKLDEHFVGCVAFNNLRNYRVYCFKNQSNRYLSASELKLFE